jgi:hypothetical protein
MSIFDAEIDLSQKEGACLYKIGSTAQPSPTTSLVTGKPFKYSSMALIIEQRSATGLRPFCKSQLAVKPMMKHFMLMRLLLSHL